MGLEILGVGKLADAMASQNLLLVVVADAVEPTSLRAALRREIPQGARVHLISSPELSPIRWLTNDEDVPRAEAEHLAMRAEDALATKVEIAAEVADSDPVLATEDVLRTEQVDEIVVFQARDSDLADELRHLHVPVRAVALPGKG